MERVRRLGQIIKSLDTLLNVLFFIAMCICFITFIDGLAENKKAWKRYERTGPVSADLKYTIPKPPNMIMTGFYASIPLLSCFTLYLLKLLSIGSFYVLIQNAENSDRTNKLLKDLLKESRKTKL